VSSMHHVLRFYSANSELVIRFYIFAAKFTGLPVVGMLVKALMNWYAVTQHAAWILMPEEAKKVIDVATTIALGDCKCRKIFKNCSSPLMTDMVIGVGYDVFTDIRKEEYMDISKDDAKKIIDECSKRRLVQSLVKCRGEVYAICNCCPCCCVPLRLRRDYGIKNVWSRDRSVVDNFSRSWRHTSLARVRFFTTILSFPRCTLNLSGSLFSLISLPGMYDSGRNDHEKKIDWKFTREKADKKLSKYYVP
jgi:hypothetical protein